MESVAGWHFQVLGWQGNMSQKMRGKWANRFRVAFGLVLFGLGTDKTGLGQTSWGVYPLWVIPANQDSSLWGCAVLIDLRNQGWWRITAGKGTEPEDASSLLGVIWIRIGAKIAPLVFQAEYFSQLFLSPASCPPAYSKQIGTICADGKQSCSQKMKGLGKRGISLSLQKFLVLLPLKKNQLWFLYTVYICHEEIFLRKSKQLTEHWVWEAGLEFLMHCKNVDMLTYWCWFHAGIWTQEKAQKMWKPWAWSEEKA